jgi:hypothetical protein
MRQATWFFHGTKAGVPNGIRNRWRRASGAALPEIRNLCFGFESEKEADPSDQRLAS